MFPGPFGLAGVCDVPVSRLPLEYSKPVSTPRPLRHPQPAHAHTTTLRHNATIRHSAADFAGFNAAINARFHPLQVLPLQPDTSNASTVAMPTPLVPYPGMPFPPGFPLGSPTQELQQLGLIQSLQRAQQQQQQSGASGQHQNKMKTPINRNYLELAMLVCNTFRGKLFPCPHCRYVTDRRNNLKRHISTMHQTCDKLLECCGVSFSTKASLREHIMIFHHNGYSCPYCGRRFCRKALLKRHLSVHSGQKDYTCPSCDYATSHKSNLERHKRIHERLKLGEDGSLFECGDFTSHQMIQSPDTTSNPCADSKDDTDPYIDIESDDDDSDIDVTNDSPTSPSDLDRLRRYPIITPVSRKTYANKEINQSQNTDNFKCHGVTCTSGSTDMKDFRAVKDLFQPGMDIKTDVPRPQSHSLNLGAQNMAVDYSKTSVATSRKGHAICATFSKMDVEPVHCKPLNLQISENVIGSSAE